MSNNDETIDLNTARAISRALKDIPNAPIDTVEAHIASAMAAYYDSIADTNVVSLSERRNRFQPRLAVAAAALLVVGGFAGWKSRGAEISDKSSPASSLVRNSTLPCTSYEGTYLGDVQVNDTTYALFLKRSSVALEVVLLDPATCAVPTTQP